MIKKGFTKIRR